MIKLEVNEECHDCPFFELDYERDVFYANNMEKIVDTTIICKHRALCEWRQREIENVKGGKKDLSAHRS